jgi:O-antigen/teichoic acid export membrane protein
MPETAELATVRDAEQRGCVLFYRDYWHPCGGFDLSIHLQFNSRFRDARMAAQPQLMDAFSTKHLQADLKGRSVRGVVVTLTSQGTLFLIQSISTVVLARLLTPADFGLVAMVTAVSELAAPFGELGLSQATIQHKEISHAQVSTLFWINVAIGLALTLVMAALGPVLARFFGDPRLKAITALMSLTFLIAGVKAQPEALLRRQMRFSSLAIRNVASLGLAVSVAIAIAWRGAGYWAIVTVPLTAQFTQMAISWFMVKWRPGLPRRGTQVGSMVAFGGNLAASLVIFGVHRNVDNILIGWYWGAGPLGLYSRAYSLLMLPLRQLNAPIAGVAVPAFSRIQGSPERFARYYLRAISLLVWVGAPLFGFLFVGAEPVIRLTLGRQWHEAAPVFQILAISGLAQLILQSTVWLFVSRGESDRLLKLLLTISPVIIGGFVFGLPFGIKGVALCYSLVLIAILPWILKYTFRGTSLTLQRLGRVIIYPISLCLVSVFLTELMLQIVSLDRALPKLLVIAVGFALVYSVSSLIPRVREETSFFKGLINELLPASETAAPTAQR